MLRRLRLISHRAMKFGIFRLFTPYQEICERFASRAKKQVNNDVEKLIETCRNKGFSILLATAAPDFYVRKIWQGDFVATQFTGSRNDEECKGTVKLNYVLDWCQSNGCTVKIVATDHLDDAPLFSYNSQGINILVNPDKKTLRFFRKLEPSKFFLIEDFDKLSVAL